MMGDMSDMLGYEDPYEERGGCALDFSKVCRYCGKGQLEWGNVGTEARPWWRIGSSEVTNGHRIFTVHKCDEYNRRKQ